MDAEAEIRDLRAKLEAIEVVHAAFIAGVAKMLTTLTGVADEKLVNGVRDGISVHVTGGDPVLVENGKLLREQLVEDAVHNIMHLMRSMDRPA